MSKRYSVEEWKNPPSGLLRIVDLQSKTPSHVVGYAEVFSEDGRWHAWFYGITPFQGEKNYEFANKEAAITAIESLE